MSDFNISIKVILKHEGGYVWDPADPGGETIFGISRKFLDSVGLLNEDIKNMTIDRAIELYQQYFWKSQYDDILDQTIATKLFDMCVNMGTSQGTKLVQRSCIWLGCKINDDGVFGKNTLKAINSCDSLLLIDKIIDLQCQFYKDLVKSKPALTKFLKQWLIRARWPK
jgi:lysozyme family protein